MVKLAFDFTMNSGTGLALSVVIVTFCPTLSNETWLVMMIGVSREIVQLSPKVTSPPAASAVTKAAWVHSLTSVWPCALSGRQSAAMQSNNQKGKMILVKHVPDGPNRGLWV